MNRWKTILSVLIALWLPLQGYAAVAMPFCQHRMPAAPASPHSAIADPSHHHKDAHSHAGDDAHAVVSDSAASAQSVAVGEASGVSCNNCDACYLACAPAIVASFCVPVLIAGSVLESAGAASPLYFYPELPQRPPRTAFA